MDDALTRKQRRLLKELETISGIAILNY